MAALFGDKQNQITQGGSLSFQAGGNLAVQTVNNVQGLSVAEVRELCALFLRDNFPQLREEAKRTAEEQVKSFAQHLEARLVKDAASIVIEKFREPDVQATINDAVQATARKGNSANPDVLCSLISERLSANSNTFKDIVLSEAVTVVPRLTGQQIACLSFVHAIKSVAIKGLTSIDALEGWGQNIMRFSAGGLGLSASQKQHLQYAGVATINTLIGADIFEVQNENFKYLGITGGVAFKEAIHTRAPSFLKMLEAFVAENAIQIELTSVGQAIAIGNMSRTIGKLDYTVWLA